MLINLRYNYVICIIESNEILTRYIFATAELDDNFDQANFIDAE